MSLILFTVFWFSGTAFIAGLFAYVLTREVTITPTARPSGNLDRIRKLADRIDKWAEHSGARLDPDDGWTTKPD